MGEEIAKQAAYFILAVVVLAVVVAVIYRENLQSFYGNLTFRKQFVTAADPGASFSFEQFSDEYDYTVSVAAKLSKKNLGDDDLIALIRFKDATGKASTGGQEVFKAEQCESGCTFTVKLRSSIPPVRNIFNSPFAADFIKGQEYRVKTEEGGIFKAGMHDIVWDRELLQLRAVCKAKFYAECNRTIEYTRWLRACVADETVNRECSDHVTLCGGDFNIQIDDSGTLDCPRGKAEGVLIDVHGDSQWDAKEVAKFSIFKKSGCTESVNNVNLWASRCVWDIVLNNAVVYADPA